MRPGIPKPIGRMSVQELREKRAELNASVIGSLRKSDWIQDLMDETMKDIAFGAMRGPWRLQNVDLIDKLVSRHMPVREERASGWKTRVVDDCTESGVNVATQACERLKNDSIDVFVDYVRHLASRNHAVGRALPRRAGGKVLGFPAEDENMMRRAHRSLNPCMC